MSLDFIMRSPGAQDSLSGIFQYKQTHQYSACLFFYLISDKIDFKKKGHKKRPRRSLHNTQGKNPSRRHKHLLEYFLTNLRYVHIQDHWITTISIFSQISWWLTTTKPHNVLHGDRTVWHDSSKNGNQYKCFHFNNSCILIYISDAGKKIIYHWLSLSVPCLVTKLENWSCSTMQFCHPAFSMSLHTGKLSNSDISCRTMA